MKQHLKTTLTTLSSSIPIIFFGPSFSDSEGREQDYEDDMELAYWESLNKNKKDDRMKLLYVTPHLSTGGTSQFLLKRIKELQKYKDEIVSSLNYCTEQKGLEVYCWCLMSSHLHLMASAKEGYELSAIIRDFKKHKIGRAHV